MSPPRTATKTGAKRTKPVVAGDAVDASATSPRPKQARGVRTRAKLVAAAEAVVAEHGYANATTKAIADAAGVAEGTIYRHFRDKNDLFLAVILDRNRQLVETVEHLPERAGAATVAANLAAVIRDLGALRADLLPFELNLLTQPEIRAARSMPREDLTRFGPDAPLAAYLEAEQGHGRVRADLDPALTAHTILATIFGVALHPASDDPATYRRLLDQAIAILIDGIGVAGAPPA